MKKLITLSLVFLVLTGCARPVWETVSDTVPDVPVVAWQEKAYNIELGLPQGVELLNSNAGWSLYTDEQGQLQIETGTFLAADLADAVKTISGYDEQELNILQTERFGLPEYQFAWVSASKEGSRVCRADLVMNGSDCYAVVCSTPEQAGNTFADEVRQTISTFGLYMDEGV
ncbi:MAG: hypothetical protein J6J43_00995 [Oscillospiraceae bacterium]|nr:hypothetical protein [Oscillospiraceae bacterium]